MKVFSFDKGKSVCPINGALEHHCREFKDGATMKRNLLIFDRVSRHMVYEPEVQLLGICLKKFMLHKKKSLKCDSSYSHN